MGSAANGVRVLIADDHAIFRDGLRKLLEAEGNFSVVGEAADGAETVKLVRQVKPDVLLLDLVMPRCSGLEALRELASSPVPVHVVVLAAVIEKAQMVEALQLGARGMVLKESSTESLFRAIGNVMAGQYWIGQESVPYLVGALRDRLPSLRYAQVVLQENPNQPEAHFLAGSAYLNLKDFSKAEAELQQVIRLRPNSPLGYMRLGHVYLAERHYDAAQKQFEQSLSLNPKQVDALSGLVAAYRRQGQNDKAIARIRQQIAQGETAALDELLGGTYADLGQFGPAEQSLKRAVELDPQNFSTYALLGSLYFRQKAIDKAIAEFQHAVRVNPKSVGAWTVLGMLHDKMSQSELAQKDYQSALAINPNAAVAANNLAWLYCEQGGDLDKALELARRAKEVLPNAPNVSGTLGWIYCKRQLYDSAIPLLQEAVR